MHAGKSKLKSQNYLFNNSMKWGIGLFLKREVLKRNWEILWALRRFREWLSSLVGGRRSFVLSISASPSANLRVRAFFDKTVRVCHVYSSFKIGFTCRITVIFGTLKDGSLLLNTLASNICFTYRNMFQNGVDALSKIVDAFLSKSSKFYLVWIIK